MPHGDVVAGHEGDREVLGEAAGATLLALGIHIDRSKFGRVEFQFIKHGADVPMHIAEALREVEDRDRAHGVVGTGHESRS